MKVDKPFKKGDLVSIYKDPQTESGYMGEARLREHRSTGLPFILDEAASEHTQETFVLDEWFVDWDLVKYDMVTKFPHLYNRPVKKRYLDTVGITNST